jgi:hypothetical protein
MKNRTIFLLMLFISWFLPALAQQAILPPNMMIPTEEELIKMTKEIEEFRASMTPAQRVEFDKQVEDLTKVMENMSEKELEEFINTVFTNPDSLDQHIQPTPLPNQQPVPTPIVKPEEPLYKPSTVPTKTIETTKTILLGLTTQLESFLRKANLIPDLYGSLQAWIPAALLADKKEITWQELKQDSEKLISFLKILLSVDPITGHYYYLASLIENDTLYQNIIRLNDAIIRHEPSIEIAPFGLSEVTKESRKATSALLGALVQAIYTQQMIGEINKLFVAFEPQAKKVMEQEEGARKRAIEESKRTPMQAPSRSAGTFNEEYVGSGYTPGLSDSYAPSLYTPAGLPSLSTPETPSSPASAGLSPEKALGGQPPATAEQTAKKEKEDTEKKQKAEAAAPDKKVSDSAEKITEKIEGFLDDCILDIKAKKLATNITDPSKQGAVDEAAGKIARIISRIKTLESVLKEVTLAQKNAYLDRIKIMVKDEKDLFDTIISAAPADNVLRKQIEALFKKLDLTPARKIIKTTPSQTTTTPQPTSQPKAKPAQQQPVRVPQPTTRSAQPVIDTAKMHPAAIPVETEEEVRTEDIHPAALQPVGADFPGELAD